MAASTPTLCPCPFCGGTVIDLFEGAVGGSYATAMCRGCHAFGPEAVTQEEAARLWNARQTAPEKTS